MDLAALKLALATELNVLEKVGEGGEGEVFLAEIAPTEDESERGVKARRVALKLLKRDRTPPAAALELRHPRIVSVWKQGSALGRPWLLMDYFPGASLRARLAARPLPLSELRVIFDAIALALEHAHQAGVVHLDVKPENVLVLETPSGLDVRLTDFGLAAEIDESKRQALLASRSLRSVEAEELRSLAGTLSYLAPERLLPGHHAPDPRADVYALGVVLFECLTGRAPSGLELPSELRPELDPRWDQVLKRALATDPTRRFPHVGAFRAEAEAVFGETRPRASSHAPNGLPPSQRPSSSHHALRPSARFAPPPAPESVALIAIPAGRFIMGERASPEASPVREVALGAFLVEKHPVTNAAYLAFVLATGARAPRSWPARSLAQRRLPSSILDHPVAGVSWEEANTYARWAGKRLPTEAEWERCARGRAGRAFPYGQHFDDARIHADQSTLGSVTGHPGGASDESVLDLTGNAWEWCADWYGRYDASDCLDPRGPATGTTRVIRGGYDPSLPGSGSAWHRGSLRPDVANPRVGFRCVQNAP